MPQDDEALTPKEVINRAFLLQWVKNGWESRAAASVGDYFHADCTISGMVPVILEGPDQVQAAYQALHARVDHCQADVSFILVRGDRFSVVMELQGTHRDTGLDIVIEVSACGKLKDSLVYQCHNVVDYSSMYAKLGILDAQKMRDELG